MLDEMKPFGHGFEEPKFRLDVMVTRMVFFNDKQTGLPRHTALFFRVAGRGDQKVMFFNEVLPKDLEDSAVSLIVTATKNKFRGTVTPVLFGCDWQGRV